MITSRHQNTVQNQNIVIENLSFEKVEKFKYLGVTVTNTNDISEEIKRRINMGSASSSVFCPRAGASLQTQAPRLQFCPKAGLPLQSQEPRLQFY